MGTKGRSIVGMDVEEVLKLLNRAFADEWLAYYQYWLGAKLVKGPTKEAVIAELVQHSADELRHADMARTPVKGCPGGSAGEWRSQSTSEASSLMVGRRQRKVSSVRCEVH